MVVDHGTGDVVWTGEGKDTAALDAFFAELGPQRAARLRAISLDMGRAYPASVAKDGHAPQATICWDPFHVVALGTKAMDVARRAHWNQLRDSAEEAVARRFKGARWALLRNPEDLNDRQADSLAAIRRSGGAVWRAYKRQGGAARGLRRRPVRGRRHRPARPLVRLGATQPPS